MVTVTARYETMNGDPAAGSITLTPSVAMSNAGETISTIPLTLTLASGQATFQAAAIDDPGTTPSGVVYNVTENITGASPRTYSVQFSYLVPTVNLSDIAPASTLVPSTTYQLVAAKGQPNGYAALDGSGLVPVSQLPTAALDGITQAAADARYDAINAAAAVATAAATTYVPLSEVGAASGVASLDSTGMVTVAQVPGVYMPPTAKLPQYVPPTAIVTQFQSGHGFSSAGTGTFTANDTTDFLFGQSCNIVTDGAGGLAKIKKVGMPAVNTTGQMIRFRVKIDDITHLTHLEVLYGSSSLANYYEWIPQQAPAGSNFIPSGGTGGNGGGWYTVTLHFADATTSGSPSRTSLTDLQFTIQDDGLGTGVKCHFQDFEIIPDASAIFPNGVVSIGFDDAYYSMYQYAFPILQAAGMRASVYLIQSLIGSSGRMSLQNLDDLQKYGWEVGSHAYLDADHALTYTGMTAAQLDNDLRLMKAWEIVNGLRGMDGTAYPLGQYGLTTDGVSTTSIIKKYNRYARTITRKTYETFPPADPYRLRAQSAIGSFAGNYPVSTITATDLPHIKANQLWGIYTMHDFTTGTPSSSTQMTVADFQTFITALAASGIPVIPAGDVLRYYG